MSILIMGMKMPKSCFSCPLRQTSPQEDPDWCVPLKDYIFPKEGKREDNCPLGEVPNDGAVVSEAEFKIYSRALLTALTLRDLMINLHAFDPTSIQIRGQQTAEEN